MIRRKLGKLKHIVTGFFKNRKKYRSYAPDCIFVCGTPEYGNIGDQAIVRAEIDFVSGILPGREIVIIPELQLNDNLICLKRFTNRHHNLCILPGGGNMGELYTFQENIRLSLVKNMKQAKLVIFPQSIDYDADSVSLKRARKIYEAHENLYLFVREQKSEEKRKAFFSECKGALAPDIVLSYAPEIGKCSRNGVLFCTRSDKEKNENTSKLLNELERTANSAFQSIRHIDTYSEAYRAPFEEQYEHLRQIWKDFSKAELVITDRLHGMIFAVITDTPCIALDNSTGKVSSLYDTWLRDSGALFVQNEEQLNTAKSYIEAKGYLSAENTGREGLEQAFAPLAECIRGFKTAQDK